MRHESTEVAGSRDPHRVRARPRTTKSSARPISSSTIHARALRAAARAGRSRSSSSRTSTGASRSSRASATGCCACARPTVRLHVRYVGDRRSRRTTWPSRRTSSRRRSTGCRRRRCRFLWPSRYCQTDQRAAAGLARVRPHAAGLRAGDAVCRWVRSRVDFRVGTSTIATSALETLEQGVGVCRDFAHLDDRDAARLNYPARFVTGVDYGAAERSARRISTRTSRRTSAIAGGCSTRRASRR